MLIWPLRTFIICGNSSILTLLIILPTFVTRGSSFDDQTGPVFSSASSYIDLNLIILNALPFIPLLSCLKKIGPLPVSLIAIAVIIITGKEIIRMISDVRTSISRFNFFSHSGINSGIISINGIP